MSALAPVGAAAFSALENVLAQVEASGFAEPSFYEEMRDGLAADMCAQFNTGEVILLKPSATRSANPLNAYDGGFTQTRRNAIVLGFPTEEIAESTLFADRQVIIDAAGFVSTNAPAGDDQVKIDGVVHTIKSLKQIPAAGVAVVYVIHCSTGG